MSNQLYSTDAERYVLGSVLRSNALLDELSVRLATEDFYQDANRTIWGVFLSLRSSGTPFDAVVVFEELKRLGKLEEVGSPTYLGVLLDSCATTEMVLQHARVIREHALNRSHLRTLTRRIAAVEAPEGSAADMLEQTEAEVF